ncbi:MAG: FAD-dependent oxidoreductase [Cypionkella sp.]|uniref:FAD-dependent oxidoreductase n=1 Tax=Cypionkella sp. TaxID=2811411 RepID=UPI002ABA90C2|nr:FAD-dependent oxidoreductase [Cypionkella sp.]MDZ4310496.1 FAD-dependent oxidoreductase [Cypionkella sp.]MDZ4392171.1 FAD-dependent oxidoreductase [Cypionkella sp.]
MITVLGAGVAGLCVATALAERGVAVQVVDAGPDPLLAQATGASWLAGGMLAAQVEAEDAPSEVAHLAEGAANWWHNRVPGVQSRGMLVVAAARDQAELARFAQRTTGHNRIGADDLAALEPDLAGRFATGLYYRAAAHLDPATALIALTQGLRRQGVSLRYGTRAQPNPGDVDCRGLAARAHLPGLRPVRGEMLVLYSPEVRLLRPVRLLHPRFPLYIVPRGDGRFMLGATMLESDDAGPISARSMMELLSAAVTLHPAFAESAIVATGVGLRPAFADNLPRVTQAGGIWHLNGLYRHGFLTAPALALQLVASMEPCHAVH